MSLVQAKCPECGGLIEADNERRLSVCQHCSEPFVVEEAIQSFNETATADALDTSDNNIVNAKEDEAAKELPLEKNGDSDTSCKELSKDFPAAYKTSDSSCKEISYDNICKEINDDFVIDDGVLKKYTGSASEVTIPYGVTSIGLGAFEGCKKLTSITIPGSVTSIDAGAFYECDYLTSITIPASVTSIGKAAFLGCRSLPSITIPDSVTSIGDDAFVLCVNLVLFSVGNKNPAYSSVDGVLFDKYKTKLVKYPEGKTGAGYTIPDGVTSIGLAAFSCCSKLISITIPDSVTSIEDSAFVRCENLTSITIPNSVKSIGDRAFSDCKKLRDVKISDQLLHKSENVFSKELYERIVKQDAKRQERAIIQAENQRRRNNGLCQHCGGSFKGWFSKKCADCNKYKDY